MQLLQCASTHEDQVSLLIGYTSMLPSDERAAFATLLSNPPKARRTKLTHLRDLCLQQLDEKLFNLSMNFVGDKAETIALLWHTTPGANHPPTLSEVSNQLNQAGTMEFPKVLQRWLNASDAYGRYALIRLATGTFKSPVTSDVTRTAFERLGMKFEAFPIASPEENGQIDLFAARRDPTPGTIDTVLMYVERGRRQSDPVYCTLGIWDGNQLRPIGRAPAAGLGHTILAYAVAHTTNRFGTTSEVERTEANALILSVSFDDIAVSARRKAGVSLVNPRIQSVAAGLSLNDAASLKDINNLLLDKI